MVRSWRTAAISITFAAALVACADDSTSTGDSGSRATPDTFDTSDTANSSGGSTTDLAFDDRIDAATDALKEGDFSTMLQLLALTSVGNEIEDRAVTILAPNDEAFRSLSGDQLSDILAHPTQIDDLLRRHVLDGAMSIDELKGKTEVTTIGGDTLPVVVDGDTVTIDGAVLSEMDTTQTEGKPGQELAVYGLDRVLLGS